jgi:hypothetical protein
MIQIRAGVVFLFCSVVWLYAQDIKDPPLEADTSPAPVVQPQAQPVSPEPAITPASANQQSEISTPVQSVSDSTEVEQTGSYSSTTRKRYDNYIGLSAGFVTGYGISYRHWFENRWGIEINVWPWYSEQHYPEDDGEYSTDYYYSERDSGYLKEGNLSLGMTYLKNLAELNYVRVLFYAGGNLQTNYRRWHYYNYRLTDTVTSDTLESSGHSLSNKVSLGLGSGVEWYVWRFAFHVMLGFYGAYEIEDQGYEARPSVEGGVHFRF